MVWRRGLTMGALLASGLLVGCATEGDSEGTGRGPSGPATPTDMAGGDGDGDGTPMGPTDFGGGPGQAPNLGPPPPVPPPPTIDMSAPPWAQDDTAMSGLDQGTIDALKTGGGACGVTVTYPYNGTIFPGALEPPIIMWDGGGESAYVKFEYDQSDKVTYEYAQAVTNPAELQIPRDAWNEITRRTNNAALKVTLNVMSGGNVGTCELDWRVAPGNMTGAIYYNTYQAPAPGEEGQGAVMRVALGSTSEIYKQWDGVPAPLFGPCISCHSVSFDGSTMVASYHNYDIFNKEFNVEKYDITQDVQPASAGSIHNANFGALTPDGSRILAMGNPDCTQNSDTFPRRPNNFPLVEGPAIARMLDTSNGEDTAAAGLDPTLYMWMPQFSPDGDKVVFNHAKPDGSGGTDRTQLAVMDYDYDTNTFSNLRVVMDTAMTGIPGPTHDYAPFSAFGGSVPFGEDMCAAPVDQGSTGYLTQGSCDGPCYPAYPFFTPDGKAVIFSLTSEPDFAQAFPSRDWAASADLWYVDIETFEVVRLDNANRGLTQIDDESNYYPTVLPVAVGGYFWMFWTSMRSYGHKVQGRVAGEPADSIASAIKKRIWVSAIKPRIQPGGEVVAEQGPLTDPSFPGFYLPGQSESGNVRAFAALNPCLPDLSECASGLDCCCGFCTIIDNAPMGQCCLEIPECAKTNEKCETDDDCCPPEEGSDDPPNKCLGGFCGFIVLE